MHNGHHHHHHTPDYTQVNRAFMLGIGLNIFFVLIEAGAGLYAHSLALLSDAGHNLSDVAGLALALIAFRLSKVKASESYTYGFQKTTILVALANAVILLVAIGCIGLEAGRRLVHPEPMQGKIIVIVAAVGIAINAWTAFLFFKDKDTDLNLKGAYIHMAADAAVSLGVVIAGVVILYTGWFWIDSFISFAVIFVIFISTWKLLKDTIRLSMDGVPPGISMQQIREETMKVKGVMNIHHIHVWAMSTTKNALTAHLFVDPASTIADMERIKNEVRHQLSHMHIQHITLEMEIENCQEKEC